MLLGELAIFLHAHESIKMRIISHTDSEGSDAFNDDLSLKRSLSVKTYLEDKGIALQRLDAVGLGESQPVADNGTEEGRERNRRTEFVVVTK